MVHRCLKSLKKNCEFFHNKYKYKLQKMLLMWSLSWYGMKDAVTNISCRGLAVHRFSKNSVVPVLLLLLPSFSTAFHIIVKTDDDFDKKKNDNITAKIIIITAVHYHAAAVSRWDIQRKRRYFARFTSTFSTNRQNCKH